MKRRLRRDPGEIQGLAHFSDGNLNGGPNHSVWEKAQMSNVVVQIRSAQNLPTLSTVALQFLEVSKNDDATVDDLATIIQADPALTARLLKVVNSSMFGLSREIRSINHAISMLGVRTVKVMALSFALVETVQNTDADGFDLELYWRRALTRAVSARLLGKLHKPAIAEEAFVAGLLSSIGVFAAWRCARADYQPVLDAIKDREGSMRECEQRILGVTHAELSYELLNAWSLPDSLCRVIRAHLGDGIVELDGDLRAMANCVYASTLLTEVFCHEIPASQLDTIRAEVCQSLNIEEAQLTELLTALDEHVNEVAGMLSVHIGQTIDYAALQVQAAQTLAGLSVQAEQERRESERREEVAREEAERLTEENRNIIEVASTDSLTKVANRAAFDKQFELTLRNATASRYSVGLLMLDIDHFKQFNDKHGHQAGDAVLVAVGWALKAAVRGAGFVARYGGEEFAIILAPATEDGVAERAEAIRRAIEALKVRHEGEQMRVTTSVGGAFEYYVELGLKPAKLIERADKKLYEAKRNGRNRVEVESHASVCI